MNRIARYFALALLAMLVMMDDGCTRAPSATPAAQAQAAKTATQTAAPNRVDAWINVTSGCQKPTVDLLKKLAQQYAGKIDVSITDFGTPEGADKWRLAGLHCMTIQFNGAYSVTFPSGGVDKTVIFQMPPGLLWEHTDLLAAFKALEAGTLRPATQEDIARASAPIKISFVTRSESVTDKGVKCGQLVVDGTVIARFHGSQDGRSAVARAADAKKQLDKWTSKAVAPDDLSAAKGPKGWGVYGGESLLFVATKADAKAYGAPNQDPELVARQWLTALLRVTTIAATKAHRAHEAAAAKKTGQQASPSAPTSSSAPATSGQ